MNNPYDPYGYMPEIPGMDRLNEDEQKELQFKTLGLSCSGLLLTLLIIVLCCLLGSCTTTRTVTVERVRTDTLTVSHTQRDSILLRDSIFVDRYVQGDTVFQVCRLWHTEYRDRWRHDTIYESRADSVPVYVEVEKRVEVDRQLSSWQRARMWIGDMTLIGLLLFCILCVLKKRLP